ncbi:inhibitor of prohead protease [Citrobacter phage CkP1]|nr:inhibitor of prohead protease [Citrobacter phage CkP1]
MLDMNYIEEIRVLDKKEAKEKLDEYASQFGIKLKKTKSFENMLVDLESEMEKLADTPLPDDNSGVSISDLIDDETEEKPDLIQPEADQILIDSPIELNIKVEEIEEVKINETIEEVEKIEEPVEEVKVSDTDYKLPENFSPTLIKMGKGNGYVTLPWWIYEWILKTPDWKSRPESFPHHYGIDTIRSLIYFIKREGSVRIRETRNSSFVILE